MKKKIKHQDKSQQSTHDDMDKEFLHNPNMCAILKFQPSLADFNYESYFKISLTYRKVQYINRFLFLWRRILDSIQNSCPDYEPMLSTIWCYEY